MGRKYTRETFIEKSISIHGDRYGYDRLVYNGIKNDVQLFCKECNDYI